MNNVAVIGSPYTGSSIGKIEDAGTLVMGGGIDRYWVNDPEMKAINKSISDADKIHNDTYTADQNNFIDEFGFKSVEFGNWLNQPERYYFLYNTAVSFKHLSDLFYIPHNLVGFNGKLSIAFGARGRTGAMAHYEKLPNIIINLTKKNGHHYLAHEYGHAIDNLLGFYIGKKQNAYISGGHSVRTTVKDDLLLSSNYFVRKLEQLFEALYFNNDGSKTKFLERLNRVGSEYLLRRTEVFARTFEVYILNKLQKAEVNNTFLVKESDLDPSYPKELINKITPIMDSIINNAFKVFADKSLQEEVSKGKEYLGAIEVLSQNNQRLSFNGYKPTYQQLDSYNHLIIGSDSVSQSKTVATGGLNETIPVIKQVIKDYAYQLKPLAKHLKADTLEQSCFNIWHFIKKNIRYDFDLAGKEEVRTPARAWKDRFNRSDCEDYAIFTSCLLINMGYSPTLRIVGFNNKDYYQHIYVVINEITIDAVLNRYNTDPKNITKVMDIQVLSGLGATDSSVINKLMNNQSQLIKMARCKKHKAKKPQIMAELRKIRYILSIYGTQEAKEIMPIMNDIKDITADGKFIFKKDADIEAISNYFESLELTGDENLSGMDEKQLSEVYFQQKRENIVKNKEWILSEIKKGNLNENDFKDVLAEIDDFLNQNLGAITYTPAQIAAAKKLAAQKGIPWGEAQKFLAAKLHIINAEANKHKPKPKKSLFNKVTSVVKSAGKKVGEAAKKVGKVIVKYNPVTILMRNSFLLLLRVDAFNMAEKFALGYVPVKELQKRGFAAADIKKILERRFALEKKWQQIGGSQDALVKAIKSSKDAKKTLGGISIAAATASAATMVSAATAILNKFKTAKEKVTKVVNTAKNVKSKATQLKDSLTKGAAAFVPKTGTNTNPQPIDQLTVDEDEQDFINNELYSNTDEVDNNDDNESSKTNLTPLWILLGVGVVGGGIYAVTKN